LTDEAKKAAWLEGDWDIVAGGMFSDLWDTDVHTLSPFRIPSQWYVNRGFDWGSTKPCATLWFAQSDGGEVDVGNGDVLQTVRGDIFVIYEYYSWTGTPNTGTRETGRQIARQIVDREKDVAALNYLNNILPGPADTSIYNEESGKCIAWDMKEEGITWTRADKRPGSRILGWEAIRDRLANAVERVTDSECDPKPGLYIFKTCTQLLRTMPPAPRDDIIMDDINTDYEDHCLDVLRYRVRKDTKAGFPGK